MEGLAASWVWGGDGLGEGGLVPGGGGARAGEGGR